MASEAPLKRWRGAGARWSSRSEASASRGSFRWTKRVPRTRSSGCVARSCGGFELSDFETGVTVAVGASLTPLLLATRTRGSGGSRVRKGCRAASARRSIGRAAPRAKPFFVPIISCWEVAVLAQRGRLRFSIDPDAWLDQATALPGLEVVPLSLATISIAVRLSGLGHPADQLVVATALERGARLVTSDSRVTGTEAVAVVP